MSDVLVRVEGVSKKFCKRLNRTMLYGIQDVTKNMLGIEPDTNRLRPGEFWSVDDVSFEVRRGECLGLIGPNGAGKSTLLKLLNGIISPDKGRIEIKGRIGALIEVTAGFHPMLTGRENIYINGSILGFSKREIDKKFDEIVEFSELGDFIDSPVKHYSSGMNVRLGFAIAAQMEPDVLLIDEVLAVGDVGFRAKCFNAITKIALNAAVIVVSHSMPHIARISSDICVFNKGKITYMGKDISTGMEHYYSTFDIQNGIAAGNGLAIIHKIELGNIEGGNIDHINYLDDLYIHLYVTVDILVRYPTFHVCFHSQELQLVAQCCSLFNGIKFYNTGEMLHIVLKLEKVNLSPAKYMIEVALADENNMAILAKHQAIKQLLIRGKHLGYAPIQMVGEWNMEKENKIRLTK